MFQAFRLFWRGGTGLLFVFSGLSVRSICSAIGLGFALARVPVRRARSYDKRGISGTIGTGVILAQYQRFTCSIFCSVIEQLEQERRPLAFACPFGIHHRPMSIGQAPRLNKLTAGNAGARVLIGRAGAGWGKSRRVRSSRVGPDRCDQARGAHRIGQAAGFGPAASIMQFQALSASAGQTVARLSSHGSASGQQYQRVSGQGALIASYRTSSPRVVDQAASTADLAAIRRGGRPPSVPRALIPCPSRRADPEFGKIGPAGLALALGCIGAAHEKIAKFPHTPMGFGVRQRFGCEGLGANRAGAGQDRVRVQDCGAFDPGKTATLGAAVA